MGYSLTDSYSPFDFNWGGRSPTGATNGGLAFSAVPDATAPNYGLNLNFGALNAPQIGSAGSSVPSYVPAFKSTAVIDAAGANTNDPKGFMSWFGENGDALKSITGVLGGVAQIIGGMQANKLAKQQLGLAREQYQTNLANQISAYNLALEDRVMGRYSDATRTKANTEDYINKHKL